MADELKGAALDEALTNAGLSTSGSADEKRARLAEHEAAQDTNQGDEGSAGDEATAGDSGDSTTEETTPENTPEETTDAGDGEDSAAGNGGEDVDLEAEREAQAANVTAAPTGTPPHRGGPTQADLNPAYAPPKD